MAAQNIAYLSPDKDPAAVLDYTLDLTDWLAESPGDTLANATLTTVSPSDLVVESVALNAPYVVLWLAGGSDQTRYRIEITVTSTGGRTDVFVGVLNVASEFNLAGP